MLEAEEMGKGKNLSKFGKVQIEMSKRLGPSISINCSSCVVLLVCSGQYQKWPKEETVGNQQQGHGWMRLIDARDERRFAHVVPSKSYYS